MKTEFIKKPPVTVVLLKHIEDFLGGAIGMLALIVTFPFIALLIKLESRGPIIFRQERVGLNKRQPRPVFKKFNNSNQNSGNSEYRMEDVGGTKFTLYKFRTMYLDAEKQGPRLCALDDDPRITKVGKWLRLFHLDEFPQFWNIIKGDMSLIGPRPERPCFTRVYVSEIPYYSTRTIFQKPGLTGLAQIKNGYDSDLESVIRKFEMDVTYASASSTLSSWLRMEFRVMCLTQVYLYKTLLSRHRILISKEIEQFKKRSFLHHEGKKVWPISAAAFVYQPSTKKTRVLGSHSIVDLGTKIDKLNSEEAKNIEISLNIQEELDNEDVFHLSRLARKIKGNGGHLSVSSTNNNTRVLLREMEICRTLTLEKERTTVKNFVTIDVECWFHAHNLKEKVPKSIWHLQPSKVVSNIERILQLLHSYNTHATFFILGWVADRFPEVVKMIDEAGHEIGTHGYYHDLIYEMTPEAFEYDLIKSLEAIGKHTSSSIRGHRASNFSIVPSTLWALEVLQRHGIEYDSSIFPIQRKRYGISGYPNRFPHTVSMSNGKKLYEFPMGTLQVGRWNLPIAGGGYLRLFPYDFTADFITRMNKQGIPVMVYFHPWEIDTQQEKLDVGYKKRFMHYVNIETTEWKMFQLLEHFNFTSISENLEATEVQALLKDNPVGLNTSQGEIQYEDHSYSALMENIPQTV